jgi:hypothetical protein
MKKTKGAGGPTKMANERVNPPSGINKKVKKESVPQTVAKAKYGKPTQTQKL